MQTKNESRIFLVYDGSINSDWVSRYAIRIAANSNHKKLFLFHILDGSFSTEEIQIKIKAIADECAFSNVEVGHAVLPVAKNVFSTIMESIPHGEENYCICGARVSSRGKGFLTGTISEQLLHANKFNVLAFRVVHPGLLGCPREILVPLVGQKAQARAILPFYHLLSPDIEKIHFLSIIHANPWLIPYFSKKRIRALKNKGFIRIREFLDDIREKEDSQSIRYDGRVVLSDDWVHETLVQASQLNARLVLLEATGRGLLYRFIPLGRIERFLRNTTCDVGLFKTI